MRLIDADELIYEIVNTPLAEEFPYDKEWFDRLQSVHHKIIDMVENAPTVGWISVKERLPEEDGEVLITSTVDGSPEPHIGCFREGYWWDAYGKIPEGEITHWLPLPEMPEVEG